MFCSRCGLQLIAGANFCSTCGEAVKSVTENVSTPPPVTVSFEQFRGRKSLERTSRFEPKKSGTSKLSEVVINVGYMKVDNMERLNKCRGKTLPVKVPATARKATILEKAVKKHVAFDKDLHEGSKYVLLYPDASEVDKIPGTEMDFVLEDYRKEIGKCFIG